ncbi:MULTISPECIES: TonB family protein [unclassified Stenotrophomonas]|uniref:TonB family protein n=1 Tax=unclassified Stenotrophomonas TaxID=196198 RepID=UPI00244A1036|nr:MULTISPECIES: TonB family protein [unclassified Stenotrophomonas]MBN5159858.1 TonB family protein [Stenotrophomonas maltophilia]MDG9843824.1 TonB family protein [Stenotrophomonas sp. GD04054]MDH0016186.1 TonB family protein [Stenotrophomonas sp. GD04028]MDH0575407.1 TonB family protein [Stenotrophomonas sp. GD03997]MDH0862691.1 TonB family protein [Stenotrophomonas sp. GD03882]
MTELLDGLWQASLWLAVGVVVLAVLRPLLVRLGGVALAYRSWWLLPLLLLALMLPLPQVALLEHVPTLPLKVVPGAVEGMAGQSLPWAGLLLLAWMLGAVLCLLRDLRAHRRFERGMGQLCARADGSWQASADPGLPALVGLWRPRIVVGPDFDQQFTAQEQGLILQHERSHRRNGDHWANGALLMARAVFWFHPLLPWASRRFLRDQELACDARTIAPQPALRGLYASTLLKAQLVHPVAPAVCHWRSQPVLKERIAMLKQSKRKALPWVSGQVLVVGLCLGMGAVAWASQGGVAGSPRIGVEPFEHAEEDAAKAGLDRPIQVDKMPPPSYPKSAVEQRQVGVVNLRVEVDAQGRPADVQVLSATNPGVFDAVSVAAARSWTYRPAMKNGKPVAGAVKIPITFAMDDTEDAK